MHGQVVAVEALVFVADRLLGVGFTQGGVELADDLVQPLQPAQLVDAELVDLLLPVFVRLVALLKVLVALGEFVLVVPRQRGLQRLPDEGANQAALQQGLQRVCSLGLDDHPGVHLESGHVCVADNRIQVQLVEFM